MQDIVFNSVLPTQQTVFSSKELTGEILPGCAPKQDTELTSVRSSSKLWEGHFKVALFNKTPKLMLKFKITICLNSSIGTIFY